MPASGAKIGSMKMLLVVVAICGTFYHADAFTPDTCRKFSDIYASGKELCENMWGNAFKYETNETAAYTMWFFDNKNPNDQTSQVLGHAKPTKCHLNYYHKDAPSREPDTASECRPFKKNACCHNRTVSTAKAIKEAYGPEYHWDRCGKMSPTCERFFVQEACFYECDPNAGLYARYPEGIFNGSNPDHNQWEVYKMPIKASYCDSMLDACRNDMFCSTSSGNYFSCAKTYKEAAAIKDEQKETVSLALIVVLSLVGVIAVSGVTCAALLIYKEKKGNPLFTPIAQDARTPGVGMVMN